MGCTGSKLPIDESPEAIADQKEAQDRKKGDHLRKEISEVYRKYEECRNTMKPLIAEKIGLQSMLDDTRENLIELFSKQEELRITRETFMNTTWAQDADDIYRAFGKFSMDKNLLILILINRTNWQIQMINEIFDRKYGTPLLVFIVNEMQTVLGKLATGGVTGLSKLLTYRIMTQPVRDAAFLRDFTMGFSNDDDNMLEILCTRTNNELRNASDAYSQEYGLKLADVIRSKSTMYKNYRDFVLVILKCEKDESNRPLDDDVAELHAQELYQAGSARTFGIDPDPFIRILGNINHVQFESVNSKYRNQQLVKDISNKLGGEFEKAVLARVADKYEYLAGKLDKALKGFSVNKETVCRIMGCLSRPDCVRLRDAYDRIFDGRSLDATIKQTLHKGHFQKACSDLISGDNSITPTGSDNEPEDDDREADREAERLVQVDIINYKQDKVISRGEQLLHMKSKGTLNKNANNNTNDDEKADKGDAKVEPKGDVKESKKSRGNNNNNNNYEPLNVNAISVMIEEVEDKLVDYSWDGIRGRFMDVKKLAAELEVCRDAYDKSHALKEQMADEINATKDVYFSIVKHCHQTTVWQGIYTRHIKSLQEFTEKRTLISPKKK